MMMAHMGVAPMLGMGATTSLLAPGVVLATRGRWPRREIRLSPVLFLVGFALLHAVITLTMGSVASHGMVAVCALWLVLLGGATLFWQPILGRASASGATRCIYLFVAGPMLDLAAVFLIIRGDQLAGLAMIVGMLPLGITAMAITWQWAMEEERQASAPLGAHLPTVVTVTAQANPSSSLSLEGQEERRC
jgi:hypothetical protein